MGEVVWISGAVASVAIVWAVASSGADSPEPLEENYEVATAVPEIGKPIEFPSTNGSALATAAFGMSALQPETYNEEIVMDIIKASPLNDADKSRLAGYLAAAESGDADLSDVLSNVRVALAVE
jgi:hypothetical protein